jgi:hypothetical protein
MIQEPTKHKKAENSEKIRKNPGFFLNTPLFSGLNKFIVVTKL